MGEVPSFSVEAHVFQIDPKTKKTWLPLSTKAVPVSFYSDNNNNNRIVCVHENKVLINSSLTGSCKFTKTSSKFGQWMDQTAATVYGLGFEQETDLDKFSEKFRLSLLPPSEIKDKDEDLSESTVQDKIKSFQTNRNSNGISNGSNGVKSLGDIINTAQITNSASNLNNINRPVKPMPKPPPNNRISNSQLNKPLGSTINTNRYSSNETACSDVQCMASIRDLKEENELIKRQIADQRRKAAEWESEFAKLKSENTLLRTTLEENKNNVEGWRKRVDEYQGEINGHHTNLKEISRLEMELTEKTERLREVERMNEDKRQELLQLSKVAEELRVAEAVNKRLSSRLQTLEQDNRSLEGQLRESKMVDTKKMTTLEVRKKEELMKLQEHVSHKINELYEMNDQLAELLQGV